MVVVLGFWYCWLAGVESVWSNVVCVVCGLGIREVKESSLLVGSVMFSVFAGRETVAICSIVMKFDGTSYRARQAWTRKGDK